MASLKSATKIYNKLSKIELLRWVIGLAQELPLIDYWQVHTGWKLNPAAFNSVFLLFRLQLIFIL